MEGNDVIYADKASTCISLTYLKYSAYYSYQPYTTDYYRTNVKTRERVIYELSSTSLGQISFNFPQQV